MGGSAFPMTGGGLGQMITQRSPFMAALNGLSGSGPLTTPITQPDPTVVDNSQPIVPGAEVIEPSRDKVPQGLFATQVAAERDPRVAYRNAIASIESAGSGDYAAVGPTHSKLGRALGRYQIMEANVGPWSQEALGRRITPQEFMADPKLQDAIFDHKFGQYAAKYGPGKAAQAWFAGEGGIDSGRRDVLGTSTGVYEAKFNKALQRQGIYDPVVNAKGGSLPVSGPNYGQQMASRLFGGSAMADGLTPGQGEQRQAQLLATSRQPSGGRGGRGVQMQQADAAAAGGTTSNKPELLSAAQQRIKSLRSSRNERRERRKQELRARSRGEQV